MADMRLQIRQHRTACEIVERCQIIPPSHEKRTSRRQARHHSKLLIVALADLLCHLHTVWHTGTLVDSCKELAMQAHSC